MAALVLLVLPHSCCLKLHYLNQPAGGAKQDLGRSFQMFHASAASIISIPVYQDPSRSLLNWFQWWTRHVYWDGFHPSSVPTSTHLLNGCRGGVTAATHRRAPSVHLSGPSTVQTDQGRSEN